MSKAAFSHDLQTSAEAILNRGGLAGVFEFAAFAAQYPDLVEWAEARLRDHERKADVLTEALRLLHKDPTLPVLHSSPPLHTVKREAEGEIVPPPQKNHVAAAAAAADLSDPHQFIPYAWQNLDNPERRLSVVLRVAGDDPVLLELVAALASRDRIPLPKKLAAVPIRKMTPIEECAESGVIRLDPELGRLAVGLKQAALLRVWATARSLVRDGSGAGWVSRAALYELLERLGVQISHRHLRRLLTEGAGRFWNLHSKRVYLYAPWRAALHLVQLAENQGCNGLIDTNLPGVHEVYVPAGGSLAMWEAHLYGAWLSHRSDPTIARDTLSKLFGRDPDTLRRWERERLGGIVTVLRNDVQCGEDQQTAWDYIPDHAYYYLANVLDEDGSWRRETRIRWRMANTYQVKTYHQHHKKGQARKVRGIIKKETDIQPADNKRGGAPGLRLYFATPKHLKSYSRKHGLNPCGRFLWRGENRRGQGIFERSEYGEYMTYPKERAYPRQERQWGIQNHWYKWRLP